MAGGDDGGDDDGDDDGGDDDGDDSGDDSGDGGGQGDINSGSPSQADFILNYFLSNFLYPPSPEGWLEQLMSPDGGDDVYVISPPKSESFPKDMGGGVAIF